MDTVSQESFTTLASIWQESALTLDWSLIFTLPPWLEVWWRHFRRDNRLYLASVRSGDKLAGIAPLQINGGTASFIGNPDVCDFQDFIIAPGMYQVFFAALLKQLEKEGVPRLDLGDVRPDSSVLLHLAKAAPIDGWQVTSRATAVSVEMDLPAKFDEYLDLLNGKQRHEVKRKIRRLEEMGDTVYRSLETRPEIENNLPLFFRFFTQSRSDKAAFLSPTMESFFRDMASKMAGANLLKLGILDLDAKPVAALLYFDYRGVRYLYNSGYDPAYSEMSAGVISKVFCIRDAIQRGMKRFDFLKGAEPYKQYLGGKEVPLYQCLIVKES